MSDLAGYRAGGSDWPRHKGSDGEQERMLGVWLHVQRIYHRQGKLSADREAQLNSVLPSWRQGRTGNGSRSRQK
ncbi:helicase associated domain-containing protein [Pseudarthrobacter sp. BRE9]|uniref:helicase associated domain-containing protein n=1 Tax=Pseudarthrobacter sp. BRE9 TaxID=2962582 RepID=UPI0037CC715F